jgi:hypothetical protein
LVSGDNKGLLYSFIDRQTLVIAGNEDAFREVLQRLSPDRFK